MQTKFAYLQNLQLLGLGLRAASTMDLLQLFAGKDRIPVSLPDWQLAGIRSPCLMDALRQYRSHFGSSNLEGAHIHFSVRSWQNDE